MNIDATKEWDGIQKNLESRLAEGNAGNIFVSPYLLRLVEAELQAAKASEKRLLEACKSVRTTLAALHQINDSRNAPNYPALISRLKAAIDKAAL